uniref:Uncharacterized protein n=1 Tax=Rhizophora mucronata TaxID=61149 RepID=A0A2P2P112_RHIMU
MIVSNRFLFCFLEQIAVLSHSMHVLALG